MDQPSPRSDTTPWTPRRLFANLRERLALGNTPLPKLIELVASEMATEVCSLYVMRTGEVLELIATCGLELEAVGRTRLRLGEGIVGLVAARLGVDRGGFGKDVFLDGEIRVEINLRCFDRLVPQPKCY